MSDSGQKSLLLTEGSVTTADSYLGKTGNYMAVRLT